MRGFSVYLLVQLVSRTTKVKRIRGRVFLQSFLFFQSQTSDSAPDTYVKLALMSQAKVSLFFTLLKKIAQTNQY